MKTTIEKAKTSSEREYPYLGEYMTSALIVLFIAPNTGTVLNAGDTGNKLGVHANYWRESDFEPLPKGSKVILEQ